VLKSPLRFQTNIALETNAESNKGEDCRDFWCFPAVKICRVTRGSMFLRQQFLLLKWLTMV